MSNCNQILKAKCPTIQWLILIWLKLCTHANYTDYKTAPKVREGEAHPFTWSPELEQEGVYDILRSSRSIQTLLPPLYLKRSCLWVSFHGVWGPQLSTYLRQARDRFQSVTVVRFSLLLSWFVFCWREDVSQKLLAFSFSSTSSPPTLGQTSWLFCRDYIHS